MLFSSAADSLQKAAEHLVIFSYESRRVLLPLPETYEEALELVKEEFSIALDDRVIFETLELPAGSTDVAVEIHPRTWKTVSPILAQIFIRAIKVVSTTEQRQPSLPAHAVPRIHTPVARAASQDVQAAPTPTREDQPAAVSRVRKRPSAPPPNDVAASHTVGEPRGAQSQATRAPSATRHASTSVAHAHSPFARSASRVSSQGTASPRIAPLTRSCLSHFQTEDEDEDEERQPRSPKKKGSAKKQRIMSEEEDADYERVEAGSPQSQEKVNVNVNAHRTPPLPSAPAPSAVVAPITPRQELPPAPSVPATPAITVVGGSSETVSTVNHATVTPSETCLIIVEYDNGEEICSSTFKTKGRHTVHKVLLTVCKTFGIESNYPRSTLMRIETIGDEDDLEEDVLEQRTVCPRECTMTQVGAHDEARFALVVAEDETDTA